MRSRNVHYTLQSILTWHWRALALQAGVAGVWEDMLDMVDRAEAAVEAVQARLPADFHVRTASAVLAFLFGHWSDTGRFDDH